MKNTEFTPCQEAAFDDVRLESKFAGISFNNRHHCPLTISFSFVFFTITICSLMFTLLSECTWTAYDYNQSSAVIIRPVINRPVINCPVIKRPVVKRPRTGVRMECVGDRYGGE